MRQSQLFTKTRREGPKDETAKNAELLIRAGFIHKEMAGVYTFLPLGLKVLKKIEQIVREEMNAIGGQEMFLTALQDKAIWEKTNRWDDAVVDNWFKTKLKNDSEIGLGFTHEEPITRAMADYVKSYKDLPFAAYQFQTKFRNEARAKSGILRGREFLMKDMYTFSADQAQHDEWYARIADAYKKIYARVGIGAHTYYTFASGGVFAKYSHEFQAECEAGEDIIYVNPSKNIALNKEVYSAEVIASLGLDEKELVEKKTVEVGNIFSLGTKFSEPLSLVFNNEAGQSISVIMGSYGIGISRLMGTIAEIYADEKGLNWPDAVAPFRVHLIGIGDMVRAENVYNQLTEAGIEVLFDDRDVRPGEKFADADLIGVPHRLVISDKVPEGHIEYKARTSSEAKVISMQELTQLLK